MESRRSDAAFVEHRVAAVHHRAVGQRGSGGAPNSNVFTATAPLTATNCASSWPITSPTTTTTGLTSSSMASRQPICTLDCPIHSRTLVPNLIHPQFTLTTA
jgi:hypothetical protein